MRLADTTPKRLASAFAILKDPSRAPEFNYRDDLEGREIAVIVALRTIDEEACLAMLWPFHAVRRFASECDGAGADFEGELVQYEDYVAVKESLERGKVVLAKRVVSLIERVRQLEQRLAMRP